MDTFCKTAGMALLMTAALCANAQSALPRTREEVRRELTEAVRDGSIPQGQLELTPRELYPQNYPPRPQAASRCRAALQAELDAPRASGNLLAAGESAPKLNELYPLQCPQEGRAVGKPRVRVQAELAEACRTGEILAPGESGLTLSLGASWWNYAGLFQLMEAVLRHPRPTL